jgi:hypothetical protein
MALHFWDSFLDPSRGFDADSSLIAGVEPRQFVGAFEDYAKILDQCDFRTAVSSQDTLMDLLVRFEAANPHTSVRRNILFMNEQFFYYTESPYRCEDYFIPVLEAELELKGKEAPDKGDLSRYEFLLEGCKMNRIGSTAKDISLISPEGKRTRLSPHKCGLHSPYIREPRLSGMQGFGRHIRQSRFHCCGMELSADGRFHKATSQYWPKRKGYLSLRSIRTRT